MKLSNARHHLSACRERMDMLYQKPVFDEWAILSLKNGAAKVLFYSGMRPEDFLKELHEDSALLYAAMDGRHYEIGDFEFVQEAKGTRFDACIRAGVETYVICNNTYGTIDDLRADPRWREAQKPFVELTERLRSDPLV